jgi:hypothetical protein
MLFQNNPEKNHESIQLYANRIIDGNEERGIKLEQGLLQTKKKHKRIINHYERTSTHQLQLAKTFVDSRIRAFPYLQQ